MMLTCPNCGNEEPEGSRFCGNCGTPFESPQSHAAATEPIASSATVLTCSSCGNEEPEGTRFCGSCGTPFPPVDQTPTLTEPAPAGPEEQSLGVEPAPAPTPAGERSRLRWVLAAGVALLVAAGATAAVLSLSGGDATEATPTVEEPLQSTSAETERLETSPALTDSIAPPLEDVASAQAAVNVGIRSVVADAGSFAALRQAGESLVGSVTRAQEYVDTLSPSDSTDANTVSLLRLALTAHLAYANTVAFFPTAPPAFVKAQAQEAITRAEAARRAYADLASADPALPIVSISGSDHNALLAAVPAPEPPPTAARRVVDLVPLLVGIGPDDPPGEGRCFGPYSARASLKVSGVVYRSGFIQCGDDASGDPTRSSGVYRFSGPAFPPGSSLARVTALAAIDESSSSSQRGTQVTWTVFYDGAPVCTATVVWSGSRPSPTKLDCRVLPSASPGGFDLRRLRIQQVAVPASSGDLWAGLLNPTIVVTSS
jgi:hypothetical protein